MGAELFKVEITCDTLADVITAYNELMQNLLINRSYEEADYYLDHLIMDVIEAEQNVVFKEALKLHYMDKKNEALDLLSNYLLAVAYEELHKYTGTFLSTTRGIDFLSKDFSSENEAVKYIEEHQQKWDRPMAAQIKGSNKWVIAGWCSS